MNHLHHLIVRAETLLNRIEQLLPAVPAAIDWDTSHAFRWRKRAGTGVIQPVLQPHQIQLKDLHGIDAQKKLVERNTRQFVEGYPANNVLLTGARGTGKSALVKAMLQKFAGQGLRLIEVDRHDLTDLPDIVEQIYAQPKRFIIFCDDLSFEADDAGYKALKVVLDGSIAAASENVLIYATSNRRHLMPEYMQENSDAKHVGDEVHPGEAVEEKISLSERFGVWASFYPFDQEQYLKIAEYWVAYLKAPLDDIEAMRRAALQWALTRGARSGRVAWQFARDWAGHSRSRRTGAK